MLLTFFFLIPLSAEEPRVEVDLDKNSIYQDENAVLELTIHNLETDWELPTDQFKNFIVEKVATQRFHNNLFGNITKGVKVSYRLTPQKIGDYSWPQITVDINGKTYNSGPLRLRVKQIAKQNNVLLFVETDDKEVFVQQEFKVKVRVLLKAFEGKYEAVEPIISSQVPNLTIPWIEELKGFKGDDVNELLNLMLKDNEKPSFNINDYSRSSGIFSSEAYKFRLSHRLIDYKAYDGQERKYHEYSFTMPWRALQTGSHSFPPITFSGIFPLKVEEKNNQLSITSHKKIRAISEALNLNVREVPLANRPQSYSGAIGRFTIKTSVDRKELQVGEPLLMNVEVSGQGLLGPISMPDIKSDSHFNKNFKVYVDNSDGKVVDGKKLFQVTLRPLNANISEIPSVPFSYFDLDSKSYTTISSKAIPIKVNKTSKVGADEVFSNLNTHGDSGGFKLKEQGMVESLTADQILALGSYSAITLKIFPWINSLLAVLLVSLFVYHNYFHNRMNEEVNRLAKTAVSRARAEVESLDLSSTSDLDRVGGIVLKCMAEKNKTPHSGYTSSDAEVDARKLGMSEEVLLELLSVLEIADQSRFGGGTISSQHSDIREKLNRIFDEMTRI